LKNMAGETDTNPKTGGGFASNIEKLVADASAKAKDAAAKTQRSIVTTVDKNENGKIDIEDFGIEKTDIIEAKEKVQDIAAKVVADVKKGGVQVSQALEEAKLEMERKNLRPVFPADLNASTISSAPNPSMVRIVERDKKRSEKEVCKGEAGYLTKVKGMEILNIYEDCARHIGIQFYPNISKTIYYIDPFQPNYYVSLDEYFVYLKNARVSELAMIAKDLGAKKVIISLKEHKKTFVANDVKVDAKVKKGGASGSASGTYDRTDSDISSVAIADEEEFSGHDTPVKPRVVYFRNESDIVKLIEMRMDTKKQNKIKSKTYTLQYSKSSGIKEKEAAEIDAVLSQMKCGGTATISSEAQRESRTDLEYHIEFDVLSR